MRITTKEKSIGIRYYANTSLKPVKKELNNVTVDLYPLYVVVVYGYSNTKFRVEFGDKPVLVSEDLKELDERELSRSIDHFTEKIQNIIKIEVKMKKDKFVLTGLSGRLEFYSKRLRNVFEDLKFRDLLSYIFEADASDLSILEIKKFIEAVSPLSVYGWLVDEQSRDYIKSVLNMDKKHIEHLSRVTDLIVKL